VAGIAGIEGNVNAEGQLNENCPLGTSAPFSPAVIAVVVVIVVEIPSLFSANDLSFSTISNLTLETHLVFRFVYPPSILPDDTLPPFFPNPNLPIPACPKLTSVVPPEPVFPTFAVADNGILRFFLFFRLKSSLPTDEVVDPASSASSASESEDSYSGPGM
jgi:hypothetical protein